jgi:transcription initiation factor TFIID subunit 9B
VKLYDEEVEEIEEDESEEEEDYVEPAPLPAHIRGTTVQSEDAFMHDSSSAPGEPPVSTFQSPEPDMFAPPPPPTQEEEEEEDDGLFAGGDDDEEAGDEAMDTQADPAVTVQRKLVEDDDYD